MKMEQNLRAPFALISNIFVWLLSTQFSHAAQSDIDCLRALKASLRDPQNYLASWDFNNGTRTSFCQFTGIDCWHDNDNSVLNIKLPGMELEGEFPLGVANCTAMTGLDLSNNRLHGPIPSNISNITASLTSLDLSSNLFSGEIPESLANCSYLNTLRLDYNRLTGQIPLQLGLLGRIKTFSVSNNQLSGPVPRFSKLTVEAYANNAGLCGGPSLPSCQAPAPPQTESTVAIIGAAAGCPLGFAIGFWFILSTNNNNKKKKKKQQQQQHGKYGNKWSKCIKGAKRIKLSMFEKSSLSKLSLYELMKATNNFSNENIIRTGGTGTAYKAVLQNGTSLMVKRSQNHTQHSEKEFVSEMTTLGNCKHRNLVPLIGFCFTKKERFLVYKHMPNGTLHDKLHVINEGDEIMDWPVRLRIATGAAKGLAWAWLRRTSLVHWNISSKCVLLDADYEPRLLVPAGLMTNQTRLGRVDANHSGCVVPEYASTKDGDVYSFGVMLLELVTRVKPTIEVDLVEWISQLSSTSDLGEAVDGFLVGKNFYSEISRVLEVACSCVLPGRGERPTMFEVHKLLRGIARHYDFAMEDELPSIVDTTSR